MAGCRPRRRRELFLAAGIAHRHPPTLKSHRGEREIREFAIIDALRNRRCPYPWSRRAEEHILSCPVVSCHHVLVSAEDRMMHKAEQVMHMYILGTGSHQRAKG